MAKNPNDIAKVLNEMVKTLEQLSDAELESVQAILEKQKEIISNNKKIEESKKELEKIRKKEELKEKNLRKEDSKTLKQRLSILTFLDRSNKKLEKGHSLDNKKESEMRLSMNFMKKLVENDRKQYSLFSSQMQVKQSSQDFDKKELDITPDLEIRLLKDIDSKIDNLTSTKGGGLLDFLMSSVKDILLKVVPESAGILEGVAGGSLLGGLGKILKKGKGATKVGEEAAESGGLLKVLEKIKNPKVALAAGVIAAGAGIYSAMGSDDSKDSGDTLQTRAKGGKVSRDDVYLVGENGPELFSPKDNGFIIPNHKLNYSDGGSGLGFNFNLFQDNFVKTFKNLLGKVSDGYSLVNKTFTEKLKTVYDDVKNWVLEKIDSVGKAAKEIKDNVENSISSLFSGIKKPIENTNQPTPQSTLKSSTENVPSMELSKVDMSSLMNNTDQQLPQYKLDIPSPNPIDNLMNNLPNFSDMKIQNNYTLTPPNQVVQNNELDEKFWMNDFTKAFSDAIKIKNNTIKVRSNTVSPAYL